MAEIPFHLGGRPKWVSGITQCTTCEDIIKCLLKMEGLLNCPEFDVSLHYVLVEKWREVEKILKPASLILKIWNAWSEEQSNVKFTVKKIKGGIQTNTEGGNNDKDKTVVAMSGNSKAVGDMTTKPSVPNNRSSVRRKNSRTCRNQRPQITDTHHPKAFVKSENENNKKISTDIEAIMKKIIMQGENIRAHLVSMHKNKIKLNPGYLEAQSIFLNLENLQTLGCGFENLDDSGINTDDSVSESEGEYQLNERPFDSDVDESYKDEPDNDLDFQSVQLYEWIEFLEKLYSLNLLLESQEEQVLSLTEECRIYTASIPQEDNKDNFLSIKTNLSNNIGLPKIPRSVCPESPYVSINLEVLKLRDINAGMSQEISQNKATLTDLMNILDSKKGIIRQLEFDVNVVEREGKRLHIDLTRLSNLGISQKPLVVESSMSNYKQMVMTSWSLMNTKICRQLTRLPKIKIIEGTQDLSLEKMEKQEFTTASLENSVETQMLNHLV